MPAKNSYFQKPIGDYRPLAFWSLNYILEPQEVCRQIRAFHDAGWGGVYIHARIGLITTYMGKEWFAIVRLAIEECRALGMTVWIYDEDRWPSGFGGDLVTLKHPEFKQRALTRCKRDAVLSENFRPLREIGDWVYCIHIADCMPDRSVAYPDLLNPHAVRSFIEEAYEPYRKAFSEAFGNVVPAMFMDEPQILQKSAHPFPSLPWTDSLPELFLTQWDYDLLNHLDSLFENTGDYRRIRHNFWRVVEARTIESFHKQLYAWCDNANVRFCGHMTCEESMYSQLLSGATTMASFPYFHIPGMDLLERKNDENLTIKQCVSVARQLGKKDVLSEMFGLAGQGATPADFRWICDWHLVNGVNISTVHLNNYSLRGRRKRDCPPSISKHQPYWPHIRDWSRHTANAAALLTEGEPLVDVLVLYTIESCWANVYPLQPGEYFRHNHESVRHIQMSTFRLMENLIANQIDFDLGCEAILEEYAKVCEGGLEVGCMTYRAIVIPACETLRPSTLSLLKTFAAGGGRIFSTGALPERIDGQIDPRAKDLHGIVTSISDAPATLREQLTPSLDKQIRIQGDELDDLFVQRRRVPNGWRVFLYNKERRSVANLSLRFESLAGDATVWQQDTVKGICRNLPTQSDGGATTVELAVPPGGSLCIDAGQAAGMEMHPPQALLPTSSPTTVFDDQWLVRRLSDNVLPILNCRFKKVSDAAWSEPIAATDLQTQLTGEYYRGPLWLRYDFQSELSNPENIRIVVEDGRDYTVWLNNTPVSSHSDEIWLDPSFHLFDISDFLEKGENTLTLFREFRPPSIYLPAHIERDEGVEIEAVILLGDFSVSSRLSEHPPEPAHPLWNCTRLPPPRLTRLQPHFALADNHEGPQTDITRSGSPFYCGEVAFTRSFVWDGRASEVWLSLGEMGAAAAKIFINGTEAGTLLWEPYALEIARHLQPGNNTLEIRLANTLRNLFNNHHRIGLGEGLMQHYASTEFSEGSIGRSDDDHVSGWAGGKHGAVAKAGTINPALSWKSSAGPAGEYRFASFGLLSPVTLTEILK